MGIGPDIVLQCIGHADNLILMCAQPAVQMLLKKMVTAARHTGPAHACAQDRHIIDLP